MSEDPIGFVGGDYNLYRYVGNNPVRAIDPFGLEVSAADERYAEALVQLADILVGNGLKQDFSNQMEYQRQIEKDRWEKYLEDERKKEEQKKGKKENG